MNQNRNQNNMFGPTVFYRKWQHINKLTSNGQTSGQHYKSTNTSDGSKFMMSVLQVKDLTVQSCNCEETQPSSSMFSCQHVAATEGKHRDISHIDVFMTRSCDG